MSIEVEMKQESRQFKINSPDDVKQWLADQATKNLRSQTAEIILALKEKMGREIQTKKGEVTA